jgi:ribosomal protein S18 acetylase RimI-like enzyme
MAEMIQRIRLATPADTPTLLEMMAEFYAESDEPLDRAGSEQAFDRILRDESLGRVWLFEIGGEAAGYVVLTMGYSMQYSGLDAFVDDLFVRAAYRRHGLGREAMDAVVAECRRRGVQAIHLEVDRRNLAAIELYRQFGFRDYNRQLLTVDLRSEQEMERTRE